MSWLLLPPLKPTVQLISQRLWMHPSQFSSREGPYYRPRTCFCNGTMSQSTSPPQSENFNGGEGIKMICQASNLSHITTTDCFLCKRVKPELADLSLSQGSLRMNLEAVIQTSRKHKSAAAFWQWVDRCEQYGQCFALRI
jgi:hypothetical protein